MPCATPTATTSASARPGCNSVGDADQGDGSEAGNAIVIGEPDPHPTMTPWALAATLAARLAVAAWRALPNK